MSLTPQAANTISTNPNATSYTKSHTHNGTGTDNPWLVVAVDMRNTTNFSGATYNGRAMTLAKNVINAPIRTAIYGLSLLPSDVGRHNVIVSFTGLQQYGIHFYAQSFTNCGGLGTVSNFPSSPTPNQKFLTIDENSRILAAGSSVQSQSAYEIGGSTATVLITGGVWTRQCSFCLSVGGLSAGLKAVDTKATSGSITNIHVEIKELVGGGSALKSSGFFILA